jgi:hypothetical protein
MSSQSNTKRRTTTTPEFYTSGTFYGLKFFDTINDDIDLDKPVICLPNVTLIESNTKAIFDFTGCDTSKYFNQTKIMLDGIQIGDGITLTNALNVDSNTAEENDLSGFYVVTNIFEDSIITAAVSSVAKAENYDKKYLKNNFLEKTEIITNASGISGGNRFVVKNYMNSKKTQSFISLGVLVGDKIRFNDGSNSGILFDIVSLHKDDNGHELLELSGTSFTEENRFESSTNFNIYRIDSEIQTEETFLYLDTRNSNIYFLQPTYNTQSRKYKFNRDTNLSPTIVLTTGVTYVLNLITSANGFSISTTEDGIWNGGEEYKKIFRYNNNVMLLSFNTSDTLYYFDLNNRGVGGKIIITNDLDPEGVSFIQNPGSPISATLINIQNELQSSLNNFGFIS